MTLPLKRPSRKLLLIEDESDLCAVLSEMLSEHDWEVTAVPSLRSSKTLLENDAWSCILLDLHLSDGSADHLVEVLRRIRQKDDVAPRVLLMTGVPGTLEESRLHPLIDGVLAKPFSISELLSRLELAPFKALK